MTSPENLRDERLAALLDAVLGQVQGEDPRFGELISSLIGHLHAFVRETQPTPEEWLAGLDFLVRTGHTSSERRNEFILLSDMLGLTTAVDDVNFVAAGDATPSSVEGPFHSPAPPRANGDWVSTGPERERAEVMVVRGRVTDTDGKPVAGATVDIWQADDAGHYDSQDPQQELGNLRGLFTTDGDGAGSPVRSVAINWRSSEPSSGALATYSTRTRATPLPLNSSSSAALLETSISRLPW